MDTLEFSEENYIPDSRMTRRTWRRRTTCIQIPFNTEPEENIGIGDHSTRTRNNRK